MTHLRAAGAPPNLQLIRSSDRIDAFFAANRVLSRPVDRPIATTETEDSKPGAYRASNPRHQKDPHPGPPPRPRTQGQHEGDAVDTRTLIIEAARHGLLADGYAGLSTRKVAAEAGVPLSQLHYHFGSKGGLILAVLEEENRRRLDRQTRMYAQGDVPLWKRYEQACDYLEDDLESGYVRVL